MFSFKFVHRAFLLKIFHDNFSEFILAICSVRKSRMRSERSQRLYVVSSLKDNKSKCLFLSLKVIISAPMMVVDHNVSIDGPFLP